jgi:propanol-preferring alcohol dehydrogenase
MGAIVVAVARGTAKAGLSRHLGAHHYIDSTATDVGAELTNLGGADVIIATAASGASMTALIPGLAHGGQLMVVGASREPIEISLMSLIFGGVTAAGSLTGAPAAYDRMMSGAARFRMVLNVT